MPENPPGRDSLAYRIGDHPAFLRRMLARLHAWATPGDSARPLAALTTRDPDDPAIALLDAAAVMADVLTFYQERIADESYLRTASERRSLRELARAVGYELHPGLAAGVHLAFTVATMPGLPPTVAALAGVKVQSLPAPGQLPQTFETIEPLLARPEWNLLRLDAVGLPPIVAPETRVLELEGLGVALQTGDRLLVGDAAAPAVVAVERDMGASLTRVRLDEPVARGGALVAPPVHTLRQAARLFGHGAPPVPVDAQIVQGGTVLRVGRLNEPPRHLRPAGLPAREILALAGLQLPAGFVAFASLDGGGVYRLASPEGTWQPCHEGLGDRTIYALYADETRLYAGAHDGSIVRSDDAGATWVQLAGGVPQMRRIVYLRPKANASRDSSIATDFETSNIPDGLEPLAQLPRTPIYALWVEGTKIIAVTDEGVYRTDDGKTWRIALNQRGLRAVVKLGDKLIFGGLERGKLVTADFSANPLATVDVNPDTLKDRTIRQLSVRSQSVIWVCTDAGLYSAQPGSSWTVEPQNLGGLAEQTASPDLRAILVWQIGQTTSAVAYLLAALPRGLPLFADWPGFGLAEGQRHIDLDGPYQQALAGGRVALRNGNAVLGCTIARAESLTRAEFGLTASITRLHLEGTPDLTPFFGDRLRSTVVQIAGEPVALRREPAPVEGRTLNLAMPVTPMEPGRHIVVAGPRHPADQGGAAGELVGEVAVVEFAEDSRITLTLPLRHRYQRPGTAIYGNVAAATHGETIADEPLGSGDGTQANQRFALRRGPLTYLPDAGGRGDRAAIEVRVNGVLWHEVPSLHNQDERAQVYMLRHDDGGGTTVIFGDGWRGARLPTGVENVIATYRVGLGPEGELPAGALTLLQIRPLGVQEVINPLPSTGAAAPESLERARAAAPIAARTLDRLVALGDYERFATTFPGVGTAQSALLTTDFGRLLHLTIAGEDGDEVAAGSPLYTSLLAALDARRNTQQPLLVEPYEPVGYSLAARLVVDPRYAFDVVAAGVRTVLTDVFSARRRALGQPVYASELVATIQTVPGVAAVSLTALHRDADVPALTSALRAAPARWEQGRARPAQMLVLRTIELR